MNQGCKCITQYQPGQLLFQRMPWVELEPTTLCFLDRVLFLLSYQGRLCTIPSCPGSSVGRALCLESRVSWVRVPPRAAPFVVLVGIALFVMHLPCTLDSCRSGSVYYIACRNGSIRSIACRRMDKYLYALVHFIHFVL